MPDGLDPASSDPTPEERAYAELLALFRAIGGAGRGAAIQQLKQSIRTAIAARDLDRCVRFFGAAEVALASGELGIFQPDLLQVVEAFREENSLPNLGWLRSLVEREPWHRMVGVQNAESLLGVLCERMAGFSDEFQVIFELENARRHYQRAGCIEDADRMQQAKMAATQVHPLHASEGQPLPEGPMRALQERYEVKREAWLAEDDNTRFFALAQDLFGIRPSAYVPHPPSVFDALGALGVVQTMEIRLDGRSPNAPATDPQLQRWWLANSAHHTAVFASFLIPFLAWCREDQPGSQYPAGDIHGFKGWMIIETLVEQAQFSPTTGRFLKQGMAFFLQNGWLPCLAVWIPCFERALRERLDGLGVQVFSHVAHPGVEHGLLLDSLLERARDHYSIETVLYWKHWFGQIDGVGHNLRNEHCHGFLEAERYQGWVALGTLFAFLFLLAPTTESDGASARPAEDSPSPEEPAP